AEEVCAIDGLGSDEELQRGEQMARAGLVRADDCGDRRVEIDANMREPLAFEILPRQGLGLGVSLALIVEVERLIEAHVQLREQHRMTPFRGGQTAAVAPLANTKMLAQPPHRGRTTRSSNEFRRTASGPPSLPHNYSSALMCASSLAGANCTGAPPPERNLTLDHPGCCSAEVA